MNISRGPARCYSSRLDRCRANLCLRRCSNAFRRLQRSASTVASPETGIVNRLIGRQLLHLDQSRSVVPLLLPVEHQLPFAAALLVYHQDSSDSAAPSHNAPILSRGQASDANSTSLVELSYVLSGHGHFTSSDGSTEPVQAGDSILAVLGEISYAAGSPPGAAAVSRHVSSSSSHATSASTWSKLVPWLKHHTHIAKLPLHKHHSKQQRPHQQTQFNDPVQTQPQQQQQQQLVMLQLLLPSELLTGELDHYHPDHLQAVAQQLPWTDLLSLQEDSRIDQSSVCQLLAGAFSPPQQQQQQHEIAQHQQQQQHQVSADSHSINGSLRHSSSPNTNSSSNTTPFSSSSSSTTALPSLSQQSGSNCVKRTLSEVHAFQLPAQTNRLALLFGPHASPAVCLSFGVEAFEPGHVTPLHTHSNAHELFFVLAGRGVGVHGPGGSQRTELSAGDVAVFPPGVLHGVDNLSDQQLYCLQMMLPNESFVEWVRSGQAAGALDVAAVQKLAAAASCGGQ